MASIKRPPCQEKRVLGENTGQTTILFRSIRWGRNQLRLRRTAAQGPDDQCPGQRNQLCLQPSRRPAKENVSLGKQRQLRVRRQRESSPSDPDEQHRYRFR